MTERSRLRPLQITSRRIEAMLGCSTVLFSLCASDTTTLTRGRARWEALARTSEVMDSQAIPRIPGTREGGKRRWENNPEVSGNRPRTACFGEKDLLFQEFPWIRRGYWGRLSHYLFCQFAKNLKHLARMGRRGVLAEKVSWCFVERGGASGYLRHHDRGNGKIKENQGVTSTLPGWGEVSWDYGRSSTKIL